MHPSSKIIKTEGMSVKEIKTESGLSMHPKDQQQLMQQQHQQAMSGHHGMYQRHGMPPQQQPPHGISREEELRR
jgi:hypothetical protein